MKLFAVLVCLAFLTAARGSPDEKRLFRHLFRRYESSVLPVQNLSQSVNLSMGLSLIDLSEVDERKNAITTLFWLRLYWNDPQLAWNESEYGGIDKIRVPADNIWYPDIMIYNEARPMSLDGPKTLAIVYSNGNMLHINPYEVTSNCQMNFTSFPNDTQRCKLKFGSWTMSTNDMDVYMKTGEVDTSEFRLNPEWEIIDAPGERNVKHYECCEEEEYVDITYTLVLKRRANMMEIQRRINEIF